MEISEPGNLHWKSDPPLLTEFSPDVYSSIKIPVNYNPTATCPLIDKFLSEVLPKDCISLIYELIGLLLIPDTRYEKAFLFLGSGANGKSTLLKLIQRFIGDNNIATESLQNLSENKFRGAELTGKLANIFPDLPDRALKDTSFFKTLVSGEAITVEQKFGQPFKLINTARFIFSANTLPPSSDLTEGFYRRWIIIRFSNTFAPGTADPDLIGKLTSETELSGLLNKALMGLKRLYTNKQFTLPSSTHNEVENYKTLCDSVLAFTKECCSLDMNAEIGKSQLFNKYLDWSKHNNMATVSQKKFNERLLQTFTTIKEDRNSSVRKWRGIRWTK